MSSRRPDLPKTRDRRISSASEREGFLPDDQRAQAKQFIKEKKKEILDGQIQKIPKGSLIRKMKKNEKKAAEEVFKLKNNQVLDMKRSLALFPDPKKGSVKAYVQYAGKEQALGFGSFGKVKFGEDLDTKERVAIKTVYFTEDQMRRFLSEAEHTQKAGWTNFSMHRVKNRDARNNVMYAGYIVLPLKDASLEKYCDEEQLGVAKKSFSEKLQLSISAMKDLTRLHDLGILHRDVKPGNILIDPLTKEAHLLDFGLAIKIANFERLDGVKLPERAGTFHYMAPEFFSYDNNDVGLSYSEKSDIYAMGETLKEFGLDKSATDADPLVHGMIHDLMARMTKDNPDERPLDEEILVVLLKVQKMNLPKEYAEKEKLPNANKKELQEELKRNIKTLDKQISEYQQKVINRNYNWSKNKISVHFSQALEYDPSAFVLLRRKQTKQFQVEQFELLKKLHAVYKRETEKFKNDPDPVFLEACKMSVLYIQGNLRKKKISENHVLAMNLNVILKDIKNLQAKRPLSQKALEEAKNINKIAEFMQEAGLDLQKKAVPQVLRPEAASLKPLSSPLAKKPKNK